MEQISNNRWEVNKIGLINYWWYDEEEFEFSDGRMILRGTNGSGKSITMQSFIPLILDGRKTPERLDPFGNKAKKIEDYVLGYGDEIKEENTSYLYMEFRKKNTDNYITIGMGLKGKRGQSIKFWGFIIKDGRRVGKDILLYKDKSNKIPLTKLELKNRIGEGGQVVETQKEYAELVNKNIFGFENIEEFDEFTKLLIEIRTPKLSDGKGFKPSTLKEILSNSLRALSDEDLRPVSESIDNMNKTKEQLEILKQSKKAIEKIKTYYQTYNEYLLYTKAKTYQEENKKYQISTNEEEMLEQDIKQKQEELIILEEEIQEIVAKIKANELQEDKLRSSKAWDLQKNLSEIQENLKEINKNIKDREEKLEKQETEEVKRENEIKNLKEENENFEKEFNEKKQEMEQQAKELDYDEYFFQIDEIEKNLYQNISYASFHADVKRYMDKLEKAKNLLQKLEEINRIYDLAENEWQTAKNNKARQEAEVTKCRLARDEEKSKMQDKMYEWEKENQIFKLKDKEKTKIAQKIEQYGEGETYDDIIAEVRKPYENYQIEISKQLADVQYGIEETDKKIEEKKEEKKQWENQKDPEPERNKKIEENRKRLAQAGIHFLPFYQTVDFKKDIDEQTRGIIEDALNDMGILDSLIIPKQELERAMQIDTNFVDKYLIAKPIEFRNDLTEFLDVSLPENSGITAEQVVNTLKTILTDDNNSENYINEKGNYRIGLIRGKSSKTEDAKYIGQEAKKKYRIKKIQELEDEIKKLEEEKQEKQKQEEQIKQKTEKLQEEFSNFPEKDQIEEKDNNLKVAIQHLQAINLEIEQKEEKLKEKYEQLKQAKLDAEEITSKMRFLPKLETYKQAIETIKDFKENLYGLEKIQNNLANTHQKQQIIQENLEELRNNLDDIRYDITHFKVKKQQEEEKQKSIEEMLAKEGTNLNEQMEQCMKLKKQLPEEKDRLTSRKVRIETELKNQKEKLIGIEEKVTKLQKRKEIAKSIFEQEANLKYIDLKEEELTKNIKYIIQKYNSFEKQGKDKSSYLDSFTIQVRENHEYLVDYNLSIETIFNQEIEEEDTEIVNLLQTRSRRDITCFVKGRKVNFLALSEEVDENIKTTESLIEDSDRQLFEEILTNTVGRKIRERIYHAKSWVKSMNDLMETIDTSSKLSFSLNWKPVPATDEDEMDTKELVDILNADTKILRQEEITKVANHFRSKFAKAEEKVKQIGGATSFHDIMKETLDYRNWFEFQVNFKKGNETKKELTNNAFFKLSGGEKAMAMYIPLFASITAKLQSAKEMAPRIIALDEAFAGVDDTNIRDMFRILTKLELEYIINSQVLWGEYDTIPGLAINELISMPESKVVSVIRYHWNGNKRELVSHMRS